MHEIRIAEDLSTIVVEAARREKLLNVTRVNLCFGQLVQIVPEIFEIAFREAVRNTPATNALLDIEILNVEMKCMKCGSDFHLTGNQYACGQCLSDDIKIIHGKELFIKSIEGE